MKRFALKTLALLACLLCSLSAAAAEAYACYTPDNTTLTFYYDNLRSSRTGTTYDLNTGNNDPAWKSINTSVTRVVFDPSFEGARPTSTSNWFSFMEQVTSFTGMKEYLNTSEVTTMQGMFYYCTGLSNLDLSGFNTANVTSMSFMFYGCSKLMSLDLSSFNTANVTDLSWMFYGCFELTSLDLSSFNTANVTNMNYMFYNCRNLTIIYAGSEWSTANVRSGYSLFYGCLNIMGCMGTTYDSSNIGIDYAHIDGGPDNPGYLSDFIDTYAVYTPENTTLTFYYDKEKGSRTGTVYELPEPNTNPAWYTDGTYSYLTQAVFDPSFTYARPTSTSRWFYYLSSLQSITGMNYLNTSRVTDMSSMFEGCSNLTTIDVSNFVTDNVTNMSGMFYLCRKLASLDVTNFNTANVTNMSGMFTGLRLITSLDLSNFNTANVTSMDFMFSNCVALTTLNLRSFNTTKVKGMPRMFNGCSALTTIYVTSGWNTNNVTNHNDMFLNCSNLVGGMGTTYDPNHVDKAYAHIDGGTSNPGYLTETQEPYAVYTSEDNTLTFYYDALRQIRPGTNYELNEGKEIPLWYRDHSMQYVTNVVFDPSFAVARPTTTFFWFDGMMALTSITGMEYLNTSEVTDMSYMFYYCTRLTSVDVSGFNTDKVTEMIGMFAYCSSLTSIDLSSFNTSNVTNMDYMFQKCNYLTSIDVSSFNTSNVTEMSEMFQYCYSLTSLDLSSWNTVNVRDMGHMFEDCYSLTSLDLTHFNTSNVTNMDYMFDDCYSLTSLDLTHFNTSNVTNMDYMFSACHLLTTIYVGKGWNINANTHSFDMFYNCTSIVGGMGTTYDANHIDKAYAHIDGGPENPGYLTAGFVRGDVNEDGEVNVADVVEIIDYLLSGDEVNFNFEAADADSSGRVTIGDVVDIIDYIIKGYWRY